MADFELLFPFSLNNFITSLLKFKLAVDITRDLINDRIVCFIFITHFAWP